ncbi:MAG: tetratricopeptide repeat protein [Verrucomicrobiota bacterium]
MKKATVCLTLAAVTVAANLSCCKRTGTLPMVEDESYGETRAALPPAADSAEWLKRLSDGTPSRQGYRELPPQAEWPAILKHLRQPGNDAASTKARIFGDILADDTAAAEKSIRTLLASKPDLVDRYSREQAFAYLYTFSSEPGETRNWVESSLPKEKPESDSSSDLQEDFEVMLAENRIDEAIAALRAKIDAEKESYQKSGFLGRLAAIARLTNRQPLYEKTVEEMTTAALALPVAESYGVYRFSDLFEELAHRKEWQRIRKVATRFARGEQAAEFQAVLLSATYQIDGPKAFLAELQLLPDRGIADSMSYARLLMDDMFGEGVQLKEMLIRSYMDAGEKENARATLAYLLALDMGNDTLYRLAIEYFPEQAGAMFEALRPYNSYQERPLIWLAELALGRKDLVKAQELIDQAIALDPSDGDQGKFTRMQVYDVLSRILRAKGETEKADFFNEVMVSIRQGEEADDYLHAGLTQEAILSYQEALGHFQDAYCLQSRLAKTLLKAGKDEEAMKHFEKAFELMPVSFGPVESHCFGCEKIFEDPRVKEIAAKTFKRVIESTPENPRTFYLLGLVLEEMNLQDEAVAAMKKALELDPKYYNCANRLLTLLNRDPATAKDAAIVQKQLAGMAPYEDLQQVYQSRTDLRQLWQDAQTPPPSPLKLERLRLPFKPSTTKDTDDYHYFGSKIDALDGWTTQELLKENSFLNWLDYF